MKVYARAVLLMFGLIASGTVGAFHIPGYNSDGTVNCSAATDTQFVPNWGKVNVSADQYSRYIQQWVYWDSYARLGWLTSNGDSTFEPDAFFYNYNGTAYGNAPSGYWTSDLPNPYVDTQAFSPTSEKAVTIGTGQAISLSAQRIYYSVTRMTSGGGASSWLKLSSQRGRQYPTGSYDTNHSFGCSSASGPNNVKTMPFNSQIRPTNRTFTAPGCARYWYNWQYFPSPYLYDC